MAFMIPVLIISILFLFKNTITVSGNTKEETIVQEATVPEAKEIHVEETYTTVWTTTNINIREKTSTDSDIVGMYYQGTKLKVTYISDDWAKVTDLKHYVHRDYLSKTKVEKKKVERISYSNYDAPSNNTIKSYMDYRAITSTGSKQYKLQQVAYTGNYGIRMVDDRYCVALGSYYTKTIGQYVDIELANGKVIKGILGDCKSDAHTINNNTMHPDGSVVELIVDTDSLDSTVRKMGDVSYVNGWDSKVVNIKVYDKVKDF